MSTPLHVQLHHLHGVPVLTVSGELDLYTAKELRVRGEQLVDVALAPPSASTAGAAASDHHQGPVHGATPAGTPPGTHDDPRSEQTGNPGLLVLDLSAVPFVDSSGLGAVVSVLKQVRAHRASMSIAGASPQLHHTLRLMGLNKVIMLHATPEDATQAATGSALR